MIDIKNNYGLKLKNNSIEASQKKITMQETTNRFSFM